MNQSDVLGYMCDGIRRDGYVHGLSNTPVGGGEGKGLRAQDRTTGVGGDGNKDDSSGQAKQHNGVRALATFQDGE